MTFTRAAMTAAVALSLIASAGCAGARPQEPDPCHGPFPPSVAHEEIDAAAHLSFEPTRAEALGRIAARPTLSSDEQTHLVAVAGKLSFEMTRAEVLRELIRNKSFSPHAKVCILRQLRRFDFEPIRADLLREMEGRGDTRPALDAGETN